jgi:hypothetical protein
MRKVLVAVLFVVAGLTPTYAATTPERGNCASLLASNSSGAIVSRAIHEAQTLAEAQGEPFGRRLAQLARSQGDLQQCLGILFQGDAP